MNVYIDSSFILFPCVYVHRRTLCLHHELVCLYGLDAVSRGASSFMLNTRAERGGS